MQSHEANSQGGKTTPKETHDPNKAAVMELFLKGKVLNQELFSQSRTIDATQGEMTSKDLFIFYPNYLVTPQMFKILAAPINKNYMTTGGYGISKTISIIFFLHLA